MGLIWGGLAGVAAGLVLGFLGAGGAVIAIPILLAGTQSDAHTVLGTNALGVSLASCAIFLWRYRDVRTGLRETTLLLVPGAVGIYAGASLGLLFPSGRLIALLGVLLWFVAAWIAYLSTRSAADDPGVRSERERQERRPNARKLVPTGLTVGLIAGSFGVAGGFLVVPALMFAGGMSLELAIVMALLPISAFSLTIGARYLAAGAVVLPWAAAMAACGLVGGLAGGWLNRRVPHAMLQRAFAFLLAAIGVYFVVR